MRGCDEELCENWSGDGRVCPCALFDLPRTCLPADACSHVPADDDPAECENCGQPIPVEAPK